MKAPITKSKNLVIRDPVSKFILNFYRDRYSSMKADIHPIYFPKAGVKCACGNSFTVGSTKEFIETEICAKCHPFYTKKEKIIDTLGRVQKFKDRAAKKSDEPKKTKKVKAPKKNFDSLAS